MNRRSGAGGLLLLLSLPLVLVNTTAVFGQSAWMYERADAITADPRLRLAISVFFALSIETIGVYLAWMAHLALMEDQASALLRYASYGVGLVAAWLNWDHWSKLGYSLAVALAILSAISPWLWAAYSRARNRTRLAGLELNDPRGVRLSTARKVCHPFLSWRVIRWASWAGVTVPADAVRGWEVATGRRKPEVAAQWYRLLPIELDRVSLRSEVTLTAEEAPPITPDRPVVKPARRRRALPARQVPAPAEGTAPVEGPGRSIPEAQQPDRSRPREVQRRRTEDARQEVRAMRERGENPLGREIAQRYNMSKRWGEGILRLEVERENQNGKAEVAI